MTCRKLSNESNDKNSSYSQENGRLPLQTLALAQLIIVYENEAVAIIREEVGA